MNNLPNDNRSFLFCTISVKTWKRGRQLQGSFYLYTFLNRHRLSIIVQSISRIFLKKIDAISRKLLHTFGFNKLTSCDVTIPGSDSKIKWKLPTILPNIHTKFNVYSFSGTVFFYCINCKINSSWPLKVHQKKECTVHIYSSTWLISSAVGKAVVSTIC